jgi:hypothetical protein
MTDALSGSKRLRWMRMAIPAGIAVLFTAGVTGGPAMGATAQATPAVPTVSLLAPTGHYRAGNVRLHLVDPTRIDPTSPTHGLRELEVEVWYPAARTRGFPPTPYLTPLAAAHFLASYNVLPGTELPQTTGHVGAPADRRDGPYPVVLYSPGGETDGTLDNGLVEDLVSHGYVVVTMDDTNESPEVEFPGGRLVTGTFVPLTPAESLKALHLALANSQHPTFTDFEELVPLLAPGLGLTPGQIPAALGTISPKTAVTDERAYIEAFFGKYLRHHGNHLLDGPSPRFPDIQFEP